MLGVTEVMYRCGGKKEHRVWNLQQFFTSLPSPLFSTVYQCDGYLSSLVCGGSWLGCEVLPAINAVSILELAANSGSYRMSRAPNLHIAIQLLAIIIKWIYPSIVALLIENTTNQTESQEIKSNQILVFVARR